MHRPRLTDFESRKEALIGRRAFAFRMASNIAAASLFILVSLFIGMAGYHYTEHMGWLDAFANASMILSGMGPLGTLNTDTGKIFAGVYALYSGLAVIITTGVILAPVAHRILHQFHVESEDDQQ